MENQPNKNPKRVSYILELIDSCTSRNITESLMESHFKVTTNKLRTLLSSASALLNISSIPAVMATVRKHRILVSNLPPPSHSLEEITAILGEMGETIHQAGEASINFSTESELVFIFQILFPHKHLQTPLFCLVLYYLLILGVQRTLQVHQGLRRALLQHP